MAKSRASMPSRMQSAFNASHAIFRFSSSHEVQCHENNRRPGPLYPDAATNPSRNDFKERANPVKAANFYYCSGCQFGATNFVILCRHAGFPARSVWMCRLQEFVSHCVGEVWYDGGWHLYDPERRSFYLAEDNETVATLLGADRIGITVGEDTGYQYQPEQSTSALICHHPQAKYFIAKTARQMRAEHEDGR